MYVFSVVASDLVLKYNWIQCPTLMRSSNLLKSEIELLVLVKFWLFLHSTFPQKWILLSWQILKSSETDIIKRSKTDEEKIESRCGRKSSRKKKVSYFFNEKELNVDETFEWNGQKMNWWKVIWISSLRREIHLKCSGNFLEKIYENGVIKIQGGN